MRFDAARLLLAVAGVVLGTVQTAHADLKVRMPTVDYRELEFEHSGLVTFGAKGSGFDKAQSYTNSIGYGVLPWWGIELEGELASVAGQHLVWEAVTLENTFQLTEPGKYPVNLGFFAEYSHSTLRGEPNSFAAGPIIQKELLGPFDLSSLHTVNLFLSHDVGHDSGHATSFEFAWQSVVHVNRFVNAGFEYYGTVEDLSNAGTYNRQQHLVGPVLTGQLSFAPYGGLQYEIGYLMGLTSASPRGAVRWRLEYELAF